MNIYESICAIMGEIDAIGKNRKNQQQGFMYRGVEDVMNTINPALTKHKVFIVPEVIEQTRDERTTNKGGLLIYSICKMKFTFYAEDGSHVEAITIGEGMDSGDKATNKAMSIAFKYACFQVFCIPTEEMVDPDATCQDPAPKGKGKKQEAPSQPTQQQAQPPKQPPTQTNANAEPQPTQAQPQQTNPGRTVIDAKSVDLLRGMFVQNGISEEFVCKLYKISNLESASQVQYTHIMNHVEEIKKRQEAK